MLMQVAVVLSFSLNHAEDNAGDTAETNTERMPLMTAHKCAPVMNTVSFVDKTLTHAPIKVNPVTIKYVKSIVMDFYISRNKRIVIIHGIESIPKIPPIVVSRIPLFSNTKHNGMVNSR